MDVPRLLEHEHPAARLEVPGIELLEVGQLLEAPCRRVIRPDVDGEVAVGKEVDRVVDVDGGRVVGTVPRQLLQRVVFEVEHPDRLVLAAAVVAPFRLPARDRLVGELRAIGRERSAPRARHGHRLGETALESDRPELGIGNRRVGAPRCEDDTAAVVRPAAAGVGAGMPRQPARFAALDRHHVHVDVAVVLAGEGHHRAVGRELRIALHTLEAGQPASRSAVAIDDPEVGGIGEDDVLVTDVGLAQQPRLAGGVMGGGSKNQQCGDGQPSPHGGPPRERRH